MKIVLLILLFYKLFPCSNGKVHTSEFFSFGLNYGDTNLRPTDLDDGSSNRINIDKGFHFFSQSHNSLWININGGISFINTISKFTPVCTPIPLDFKMISPFWADVDLKYGGNIFYRQTNDRSILEKAKGEVTRAFPRMNNINLNWAFITTWYKVGFFRNKGCNDIENIRNTFQAILTTDGVHSFAIFYYEDIMWITGMASGGDCTGLSEKNTVRAGFDAGDGQRLINIPGSCGPNILKINENSNYGSKGKWVFRVDLSEIQTSDPYLRIIPNLDTTNECHQFLHNDQGIQVNLPICPPKIEWAKIDPEFEIDECTSPPCEVHPGAESCFRSKFNTTRGGSQQCCYANEKLIIEIPGAGSAKKSHPNNIECHHKEDVIPWINCCKDVHLSNEITKYELCSRYYEKRPKNNGHGYKVPKVANARGDPHFNTFDGVDYTFNGEGDFWLIKNISDLNQRVQCRMERPKSYSEITVFRSFAMQCKNSPVIEIQKSRENIINVYINGIRKTLNSFLIESYPDVKVEAKNHLSTIILSFSCGFSFEVITDYDWYSLIAFAKESKQVLGKTRGLLGYFDGIRENDLQNPNGNSISMHSTDESIHNDFGIKWRTSKEESMFIYNDKTYEEYNRKEFVPIFSVPNLNIVPSVVKNFCQMDRHCIYDFVMTGNSNIANGTRVVGKKYYDILAILNTEIILCPNLEPPINGYIKVNTYYPGGIAKYFCYENPLYGYTYLDDDSPILCLNGGKWNSSHIPHCIYKESSLPSFDQLGTYMYLGLIIPGFLLAILA